MVFIVIWVKISLFLLRFFLFLSLPSLLEDIKQALTVTGEVAHPVILRVPVGTPLLECVEAAGGTALSEYRILCGGPMMGKLYTMEEARREAVTKTTSGITVLPPDIPLVRERETPLRVTLRTDRRRLDSGRGPSMAQGSFPPDGGAAGGRQILRL